MMSDIKFYDTSSLLIAKDLFQENFAISSITLNELENIKTSKLKDNHIKYQARQLLKQLDKYRDKYITIFHTKDNEERLDNFTMTDDMRILSDAIYMNNYVRVDEVIFVTNDIALKSIAELFLMVASVTISEDSYCGYREIECSNEDLTSLYENNTKNYFNLQINEYAILKQENEIVDVRKWTGHEYAHLNYQDFQSRWFDKIQPYKQDIYQKLAFDSLINNQITVLRGPAGSGKSYLGLGYLFHALERGRIDKIIMFVNPVATKDSCKFGFLPGEAMDKILGSQIGYFLTSKLGDRMAVERMIELGKLELIPIADARGYDTTGMRAGIYITEAQNTTISMMKLLIERIGEDSIAIIEGDDDAQVDLEAYANYNNGLRRLCEVFKGEDYFGTVTLKNCYRSRIAAKAAEM